MSTVTLFDLTQVGVRVTVVDGKLRLCAPAGRLTSELRERVVCNRRTLLQVLRIRSHLLALAESEGVDIEHIRLLHDADLAACEGLPDNTLLAYLRALARRERMDRGLPPLDWGDVTAHTCEGCGPVLLWASCPNVVKACPWCFGRKAGKPIARPAYISEESGRA